VSLYRCLSDITLRVIQIAAIHEGACFTHDCMSLLLLHPRFIPMGFIIAMDPTISVPRQSIYTLGSKSPALVDVADTYFWIRAKVTRCSVVSSKTTLAPKADIVSGENVTLRFRTCSRLIYSEMNIRFKVV
jgi:hypothetical protein